MKLKVNDNVIVIAGKDRTKKGRIIKKLVKQSKIVVEKINLRTKHIRKTSSRPGERIQLETPIHSSNVKLICPSCKKPARIGYLVDEKGKKVRICKKCSAKIDQKTAAAAKK